MEIFNENQWGTVWWVAVAALLTRRRARARVCVRVCVCDVFLFCPMHTHSFGSCHSKCMHEVKVLAHAVADCPT